MQGWILNANNAAKRSEMLLKDGNFVLSNAPTRNDMPQNLNGESGDNVVIVARNSGRPLDISSVRCGFVAETTLSHIKKQMRFKRDVQSVGRFFSVNHAKLNIAIGRLVREIVALGSYPRELKKKETHKASQSTSLTEMPGIPKKLTNGERLYLKETITLVRNAKLKVAIWNHITRNLLRISQSYGLSYLMAKHCAGNAMTKQKHLPVK